jgi:hypothetical protein
MSLFEGEAEDIAIAGRHQGSRVVELPDLGKQVKPFVQNLAQRVGAMQVLVAEHPAGVYLREDCRQKRLDCVHGLMTIAREVSGSEVTVLQTRPFCDSDTKEERVRSDGALDIWYSGVRLVSGVGVSARETTENIR